MLLDDFMRSMVLSGRLWEFVLLTYSTLWSPSSSTSCIWPKASRSRCVSCQCSSSWSGGWVGAVLLLKFAVKTRDRENSQTFFGFCCRGVKNLYSKLCAFKVFTPQKFLTSLKNFCQQSRRFAIFINILIHRAARQLQNAESRSGNAKILGQQDEGQGIAETPMVRRDFDRISKWMLIYEFIQS